MSKSPSLRRIQADIRELALDPSDRYHAAPLENDMFEWHFTIRGADDTEFEGGVYHGRILLPAEYPFKPPNIIFLTPSGRFETNTKVCLSFSAFHPELWQPAWGIRLILEALISFLPTPADGAIGSLDWSKEERRRLAKKSIEFSCPICGNCAALIPKNIPKNSNSSNSSSTHHNRFQKEIEKLHQLQAANEGKNNNNNNNNKDADIQDENKNMSIDNTTNNNDNNNDNDMEQDNKTAELNVKITTEEKPNNDNTTTTTIVDVSNVSSEEMKEKQSVAELPEKQAEEEVEKLPSLNSKEEQEQVTVTELPDINNLSVNEMEQNRVVVQEGEENTHLTDEIPQNTNNEEMELLDSPWLSDPIIHTAIVCLSIILFLLVKKVNDIMEEMKALEEMYSQT